VAVGAGGAPAAGADPEPLRIGGRHLDLGIGPLELQLRHALDRRPGEERPVGNEAQLRVVCLLRACLGARPLDLAGRDRWRLFAFLAGPTRWGAPPLCPGPAGKVGACPPSSRALRVGGPASSGPVWGPGPWTWSAGTGDGSSAS